MWVEGLVFRRDVCHSGVCDLKVEKQTRDTILLGYHKHSKKGTASSATIASILLAWIVGKRCLQEEPEVDSEQVAKSIGSATIVASFHDARVDNARQKNALIMALEFHRGYQNQLKIVTG